jgi:hypothetical protein
VALKEADRKPIGKEFVDKFEQFLDSEVNGITMEGYEFNSFTPTSTKFKQERKKRKEETAKEEEKKEQAEKGNVETVSEPKEVDADDHQGDSRGRKLRRRITGRVVDIEFPANIEHGILESVDGDSKKWTDMKKKMAQSPNRFFQGLLERITQWEKEDKAKKAKKEAKNADDDEEEEDKMDGKDGEEEGEKGGTRRVDNYFNGLRLKVDFMLHLPLTAITGDEHDDGSSRHFSLCT